MADEARRGERGPAGRGLPRIVGRRRELEAIARRIEGGVRLVTVVGPPGIGKTRLALEHLASGAGAARFCDLSDAASPGELCRSVLAALDEAPPFGLGDPELAALTGEAIAANGRFVLVLDNFEQLVADGARLVGRWIDAAPEAQLLVTSRERLRLRAEVTIELGPLGLEGDGLARSEAAQLFVERAEAIGARTADADEETLAAIVRRLDGIPLAVELAAARSAVLGPQEILGWLRERFALLAHAPRDAVGRQATLRAAIDWSWNLLDEREQEALAACSVFRGGFDLAAAGAVLAPRGGRRAALERIRALREKSLLQMDQVDGVSRFGMLLSIREYAAERLAARRDRARVVARHSAHYRRCGRAWAAAMTRTGDETAQRRLSREQDNLLAIARGARDPRYAVQAVLALDPLLRTQGPHDDHLALLDAAIERAARGKVTGAERAALLAGRGEALRRQGSSERATRDLRAAIASARRAKAALSEGRARASLGMVLHQRGRLDAAEEESRRALAIHRRCGDLRWAHIALNTIGLVLLDRGELDAAERCFVEVLARAQRSGDAWAEGVTLTFVGEVRQEQGRLEEAADCFRLAAARAERVLDRRSLGLSLGFLAAVEHEAGATDDAIATFARALPLLGVHGGGRYGALHRMRFGGALADRDRIEEALSELDGAAAILTSVGDPVLARALALHRGLLDVARARRAARRGERAAAHRLLGAASDARARMEPDARPEIRLALRLLDRALDEARALVEPRDDPRALRVATDGSRFCAPGGDWTDIGRRAALCRILARLAGQRLGSPGAALRSAELVAVGWPGERMRPDSGDQRLRVAVATLRKLGLRGALVTRSDGYLLDPRLPVRLAPDRPQL